MRFLSALCLLSSAFTRVHVDGLIHEQVAFDNSAVCWWSLVPPDLVCPVLKQHNLTDIVSGLVQWQGGDECEGIYCLYFNKGFAGGRGIAVITTPENVARVKEVGDLLQEYNVSFTSGGPFHIDHIEGKGEGIIADRPLIRGEPIMAHTPVLLVHCSFKEDLSQEKQRGLLESAVHSLPDETAKLFMPQMAHLSENHHIATILTTNAFKVSLHRDNGHHYGAFPELAKLNHDCRPNAAFYFDPSTLMHITTAVRSIKPDEEITLQYLDPLAPRAERQERAQLAWASGCRCSQCSLPDQESAESDTRLKEIRWIESQLEDFNSAEDVSVGLITYLLKLYKDERLDCCMAGAYTLAALNFNLLGYDKRAQVYAGKALDALAIEKGENAPDLKTMEDLRASPKEHFSWMGRVKKGER